MRPTIPYPPTWPNLQHLLAPSPPIKKSKPLHPSISPSSNSIMPENQKQGEVMWPRLVANKLFRMPSGSNDFVADFPSAEGLLEDASSNHPTVPEHGSLKQKEVNEYKVFVSTWNVGGVLPTEDLNLDDWLDSNTNTYDIYILGFQEIVPLHAKNIFGRDKNEIPTKWNSIIRATLKSNPQRKQGEKQRVHPIKDGNSISHDFRCIISKQMVGIFVSVWVRGDLREYIRHPSVSCIGCGIMGCLGNKGAVSVRFFLHETSFCVVGCHLASGGKQGDVLHRNSDAMEILTRTSFPQGSHDLPTKILDHDRIILLGDLNYRISLPESTTRSLAEQNEWNILLDKDQLRGEVLEGRVFEGWHEGVITFSPTYKYYPNSDEYCICIEGKKGQKRRLPAWCDRILWHANGLRQVLYDRCELGLSDHRPVRAIFIAEVKSPRSSNSLEGFFLSDRLDHIGDNFDLFFKD